MGNDSRLDIVLKVGHGRGEVRKLVTCVEGWLVVESKRMMLNLEILGIMKYIEEMVIDMQRIHNDVDIPKSVLTPDLRTSLSSPGGYPYRYMSY